MKKIIFLFCSVICCSALFAQTEIIRWDFMSGVYNTGCSGSTTLETGGGANASFNTSIGDGQGQFWVATGWDGGSGSKHWGVHFAAPGFTSIKVSSKQRSTSLGIPSWEGPRDFKLQYSTDNSSWTDVTNVPSIADDWTSGVLSNVTLPGACDNQPDIYLRWIMTSNTGVNGSATGADAQSMIDDIIITGTGSCTVPPSVSSHPADQTICVGGFTAFSITANDATSYQWQVDNGGGFGNISNNATYTGATTSTLVVTNATSGMDGNLYRCVVTGDGSVNSNSASLTVNHVPTLVITPADTQVCSGSPVVLAVSGAEPGVNALTFDGTDDFLEIADHADLRPNTGITLSAWVNPAAPTGDWEFIISKEGVETDFLFALSTTNQLHGRFLTNGSWHDYTTVTTIPYGEWSHVAVTYDNADLKVYINGSVVHSDTWNETLMMGGTNTPVNIGMRGDGAMHFLGQIDEASIWDRALTPTEMEHLMNINAAAAGSGMMGYWQMDEGSGPTVADASGNGHTASLYNGPVWGKSLAGINLNDYGWSPATGLSGTTGDTVTATITSSQTYTVSYTTYQGCVATATADVNIASSCPPTWNGTSTWSSNPNWINGVPDPSDSVIVQSGTVTVDANAIIEDLTLENGASLVVASGNTLTVTGEFLNNGGTFTVQTGGTLTFEGDLKKSGVTRLRTPGKLRVMGGSLLLKN